MKKVVIESTLAELPPFGRYRQGYLDGYSSEDGPRMPHDSDYMNGWTEGRFDDGTGLHNKFLGRERHEQED